MDSQLLRRLAVTGAVGLWLAASVAAVDRADTTPTPVLEYERHMIQGPDPGPRLALYADGRLRVHVPSFLKRSGDYELFLGPEEVDRLWRDLDRWGVIHFDSLATAEALRRAAPDGPRLVVPGAAWTIFRLRPESLEGRTHEIRWQGVPWSAAARPDHEGLVGLDRARRLMESLLVDPRLEPSSVHPPEASP